LVAKVVKNEAAIVVLPEPKASAALSKNAGYSIDLNLSTEWDKVSDTPLTMGCIVARNDLIKEHPLAVERFLTDCKNSIEFIGSKENTESAVQMIVAAGIIPAAPMATKALSNLYGSIVFIGGSEMKEALISFYNAIGQALPNEGVYYGD
jgi:NitT/TauT family transport system substrate-binding protein